MLYGLPDRSNFILATRVNPTLERLMRCSLSVRRQAMQALSERPWSRLGDNAAWLIEKLPQIPQIGSDDLLTVANIVAALEQLLTTPRRCIRFARRALVPPYIYYEELMDGLNLIDAMHNWVDSSTDSD
jgi:hypothetical protein